jgi:lipopolysaccharide export system protein LptA
MKRHADRAVLVSFSVVAGFVLLTGQVNAGIPRGVMLSADEQSADETTGVTIARGNAELTVEKQPIRARADVIELRPKSNEILLKGRADLSVGSDRYRSDTVTCTLDFSRCLAVEPDQDLPDTPGGAAATLPR